MHLHEFYIISRLTREYVNFNFGSKFIVSEQFQIDIDSCQTRLDSINHNSQLTLNHDLWFIAYKIIGTVFDNRFNIWTEITDINIFPR